MAEVFLASRNAKKVAEMQRILDEHLRGVRVLGLDDVAAYDEPAETEPTFSGNALLKARAGLQATGLPTLADDSGLCVDALNGMPGVLSARWSGLRGSSPAEKDHANNALLLAQLDDVPPQRRGAHFACAVAFVAAGSDDLVVEAEMKGRVIDTMRGAGGFGYDVLFCAEGYDQTTAQLTVEAKDRISHRGKALRQIAPLIAMRLTDG